MYINLCGLQINYETYGEGKELILLHGWGANIQSLNPIILELSTSFKVIALDFPGFGKSQTPKTVWGISDYARLVKELIDRLSIDKPIILGHSFGGRVIIYLTGKFKVSAHKLILVDSAGIKPKRSIKYYYKVFMFKTFKNIVKLIFPKDKAEKIIENSKKKHGSSDYKNASGILRQIMVKTVNEDLMKYMPKIGAPTLLIWGENDTATPVSDGKIMEKLIPDAGLVVLKNAGHFSYLEKSYEFNLIVKNFLREDIGAPK